MVQDIARRLQIRKHHHTKEQHKRMLSRTFVCKSRACDFAVVDNRKITPDMRLN